MSQVTVHQIVSELQKDSSLIENWKLLVGGLQVSKALYVETENTYKNGTSTFHELLTKIIEVWVKGDSKAIGVEKSSALKTVGALSQHLISHGFQFAAETLENQFGKESVIEGSAKVRFDGSTLLGKWWPWEMKLVNSFIERSDEGILLVDKLHDMLNEEEQKAVISQHACISGLGGIGKTSLAKWYTNRYAECYDHIFWLDCGEDSLGKSITSLYQHFCVIFKIKQAFPASQMSTFAMTKEIFTILKDGRALFIYDNAENYNSIKETLPETHMMKQCKCLITSRRTSWGTKQGYGLIPQLQLEVFSMEESVAFLKGNLMDGLYTTDDLEELAELLGHLPLALQIALAHLNRVYRQQRNGVAAYVQALRQSIKSILLPIAPIDDYNKGLMATLTEAAPHVKGIPIVGPRAWELLCYMAYLPPTGISVQFLACVADVDWNLAVDLCEILKEFSLATLTIAAGDKGEGDSHISVHRLLRHSMQLLNHDFRSEFHKKILSCRIAKKEDALYKWGTYLESKDNTEIQKELSVAANQIYEGISLHDVLEDSRISEALTLLDVYSKITNDRYPPLTDRAVHSVSQTKVEFVILFLRGLVHDLLNEKALALNYFVNGQARALSISCLSEDIDITDLDAITFTQSQPVDWESAFSIVKSLFSLWIAKLRNDLGMFDAAIEEARKIPKLCRGALYVYSPYGSLFRFDLTGAEFLSELRLAFTNLHYESCVQWIQKYSDKEFKFFTIAYPKFTSQDGTVICKVDYHTMLPVKCEALAMLPSVECPIDLNMSHVWAGTRGLELVECNVIWNTQRTACELQTLILSKLSNQIPSNVTLQSLFPNLCQLKLKELTVCHKFFPATLDNLSLHRVTIIEDDPQVEMKHIAKLTIKNCPLLNTLNLFSVQELLVKDWSLEQGRWEEMISAMDVVQITIIKKKEGENLDIRPLQSLGVNIDECSTTGSFKYLVFENKRLKSAEIDSPWNWKVTTVRQPSLEERKDKSQKSKCIFC